MGFVRGRRKISQKEKIISLLKVNQIMTQSDLAEDIYEDRFHTSNIYSALMSLVDNDIVTRSGEYPARYSLSGTPISEETTVIKKKAEVQQYKVQQQTVTMSVEKATHLIRDYFNKTVKDKHGRYMSWRHCYKAFSENRNITDEQTVDYLALHLAFYLASGECTEAPLSCYKRIIRYIFL